MTVKSTRTSGVQSNYFHLMALTGATCLICSSIALNILAAYQRGSTDVERGAWIAAAIAATLITSTSAMVAFGALGVGLVKRTAALLLFVIALAFSTANALSFAHGHRAADASQSLVNAQRRTALAIDRDRLEYKALHGKSVDERKGSEHELATTRKELERLPVDHDDPGAVALSEYGQALGVKLPAAAIAAWLSLLPVLLLELGSSLALLVASGLRPARAVAMQVPIILKTNAVTVDATPANVPAVIEHAATGNASNVVRATADHLRMLVAANGNTMKAASKREWSRRLDVSPATASRALAYLAITGAAVSVLNDGSVSIALVA